LPHESDEYIVSLRAETGTAGPFKLHTDEFHPAIPDALRLPRTQVTTWYDRGTNDLIGFASDGQRYSMEYLNRPRAKYWDAVGVGVAIALAALFLLFLALGIGLLWRNVAGSRANRAADDQAQSYEYTAYSVASFVYGVTAFIGFIVASIRWGSMPFWGLVIGGVLSSTVAISEGPLIERLEGATRVPLGWIPKAKYDLSLLSLVVVPAGVAVILTLGLTYVERQL